MLPKIGIALGGGMARGWAHIGVLRALARAKIKPHVVAGTSTGAVVGAAFAGGALDDIEQFARTLTAGNILKYLNGRMGSNTVVRGDQLSRTLARKFGQERIERLPIPFAAVATDLTTGHEIWLRDGPMLESVEASYALPGIFPPVRRGGRDLVDGSLVNPVPVSVCRALGADVVIAVTFDHRTAPEGYRDTSATALRSRAEKGEAIEDARWLSTGWVSQWLFAPRAEIGQAAVVLSGLSILLDRVARARLAADPPDVVISPRVGHIGLLEFDRASEVIVLGDSAATGALDQIKAAVDVAHVSDAGEAPAKPVKPAT